MTDITKLKRMTGEHYAELNAWISNVSSSDLLDVAFPKRDGVPDNNAIAEMLELRENLYNLEQACEMAIKHLSNVIDLEEE